MTRANGITLPSATTLGMIIVRASVILNSPVFHIIIPRLTKVTLTKTLTVLLTTAIIIAAYGSVLRMLCIIIIQTAHILAVIVIEVAVTGAFIITIMPRVLNCSIGAAKKTTITVLFPYMPAFIIKTSAINICTICILLL